MTIDFWRALGVTAGVILVSSVVNVFVYGASANPLPLQTADTIATLASVVVIGLFSYLYFKNGPVRPSAQTGFYLGCVLFAYTFLVAFLNGYLAAIMGQSSQLPPPALWLMWASVAIGIIVPTLVGWYLGKNK